MNTPASTVAITTKEAADPKGQFRAAANWFWIRLPISISLAPPSKSDGRKEPSAGMNPRETETLTDLIALLRRALGLSVLALLWGLLTGQVTLLIK